MSLAKLRSWYILLYAAFVTVTLVTRRALSTRSLDAEAAGTMVARR